MQSLCDCAVLRGITAILHVNPACFFLVTDLYRLRIKFASCSFNDHGIEVMEWLAQSHDLNPIENVWDQITTRVNEKNPCNLAELWTAVNAAWDDLPTQQLEILFESMPRIYEATISARGGGATRY